MSASKARVLILEDRPPDRLYLSTLLGYAGYTVVEAANGEEGLTEAAKGHLNLVISDVLMPTMDGYEFVRRFRSTDVGATVPIIFYTATYHERDARVLAAECGVIEVMIKPSEPAAILARVQAVLARGPISRPAIATESFARQHVRITSDTLVAKVQDLEASERRMAGLVEIGHRLIEERDPLALLSRVCETVREITHATYAVAGVFNDDLTRVTRMMASGLDDTTLDHLRSLPDLPPLVRAVALERRVTRGRNRDGRPENLHLPPGHAPVYSFMAVPLASRGRVYGFFSVGEKIGADAFTDADEQVAVTLGVQAGFAYENALLIRELETQAAALKENRATTEFALSAARIGIFDRDLVTNVVSSTGGSAEIFGMPDRTGLDDAYAMVHPDDREKVRSVVEQSIRERGEFTVDMRAVADGDRVSYRQLRGKVMLDDAGEPKRLLAVVIDMTERRELEIQFRQAQKMEAIGQLAGGVAHDFNNLLTAILGYSHFLLPTLTDPRQRDDVAEIVKAGERAAILTRQLLAFSRRQAPVLSVFDVNLVITDIAPMLKRLIGQHIGLTTTLQPALSPVNADRGQIEQVIMNLVLNARDAMPAGGSIVIETSHAIADNGATRVRLTVADTGTGMTDATRARLFEPFFTTKEVGKGTGLGLSTVFGIVSQAGGEITVDSVLGTGSTFTVLLPPADDDTSAAVAAMECSARTGTESVLLVDDEQAVRFVSHSMLERAGYRVAETATPEEALRVGARGHFDILVTDVMMPGMLGRELYRRLTETRPALKVLYISGYAEDAVLDTSRLAPAEGFLAKPFTSEALTSTLREILDR